MFILVEPDGQKTFPVNQGNLQSLFPSTSFPKPLPQEGIPDIGVYPLVYEAVPAYDENTEEAVQQPPEVVNGVWTVAWKIRPLTAEQLEIKKEQKAAAQRNLRDGRLLQSDWSQLPDSPVNSAAWAVYRQALRDVPTQPGFPWEVTWPEQPA